MGLETAGVTHRKPRELRLMVYKTWMIKSNVRKINALMRLVKRVAYKIEIAKCWVLAVGPPDSYRLGKVGWSQLFMLDWRAIRLFADKSTCKRGRKRRCIYSHRFIYARILN